MAKDTFILYKNHYDSIRHLTDTQLGALMRLVFLYERGEELEEITDPSINMAFSFIKVKLDENRQKYEERCKKNAENARSRNARQESDPQPSHTTANDGSEDQRPQANDNDISQDERPQPIASDCNRTQAMAADTDNDTDSDTDSDLYDDATLYVVPQGSARARVDQQSRESLINQCIAAFPKGIDEGTVEIACELCLKYGFISTMAMIGAAGERGANNIGYARKLLEEQASYQRTG